HGRRLTGQHVGAVALTGGDVDDPQARDALGDPLVDHEMAPVPVVLLGDVGQRALAGQVQRRHAGRLIALDVQLGHAAGNSRWLRVRAPARAGTAYLALHEAPSPPLPRRLESPHRREVEWPDAVDITSAAHSAATAAGGEPALRRP